MRWFRRKGLISGANRAIEACAKARPLTPVLTSVALALAACSGSAGKTEVANVASVKEPATDASAKRLRLVSAEEYRNTLAYIFGPDMKPDARFAPLQRTDG